MTGWTAVAIFFVARLDMTGHNAPHVPYQRRGVMTRWTVQRYDFDNASDQAGDHHDALGRPLNAQTRQFIGGSLGT
ncbi:hypothetical protein [Paractinoplanes toevensis]|uniref:Uncharacterized protein n=1 Tax=Paractinoplanes toevensis TaxID=571911 RepID=A0A919WCZ6_9ACTN|nr:hypothetical protein [Actinoplanes toevensis]GIM97878.1 hypothetical protein Ato02nite_096710 [Actinoplanes toevensis]